MKGSEMRAIRERLGLTPLQLAREIGYTGTDRNDDARVREYERVWLHAGKVGGACGCLNWPEWPGYEFEHTPDAPPEPIYRGYTR